MGKLQLFEIVFDQPQGVYYAGQAVCGKVNLILGEAMTMRGVVIHLLGKAKVHWSVSSGKNKRTHYRAEETYFDFNIFLLKPANLNDETLNLAAGSYSYPFQMALPPTLPSSFEGQYGSVRYLASVKIDKPWKFDHVTKSAFTVLSILDLNREPATLQEPFTLQENKDVSYCCCVSGLVDASFTINRRCFVPGETIVINGQIINNSNSTISQTTTTLKESIEFLAQSQSIFGSGMIHVKSTKQVVDSFIRGEIAAGGTDVWTNVTMTLPSLPPSRLVGCECINITYHLKFKIDLSCGDVTLPIEIIIGTIPLMNTFSYAPPATITQQPSAPPLQDIGVPYDLPPPSYEECVHGKVTIREEDDSDHVRGNLNWAPMYPMYRFSAASPPPPFSSVISS